MPGGFGGKRVWPCPGGGGIVSRHLAVDLSAHGLGHLAQTAPVLNALRERYADLRLTVRGDFPLAVLAARIHGDFEHVRQACDVGLVMASSLDVLRGESARAYERFHVGWHHRVEREAASVERLGADLLLADVPYLGLAAAKRAGLPAIALSSLNWAVLYRHYCGSFPRADRVHAEILAAYRGAECFLRLEPGLPMEDLDNVRSLGPIAALGRERAVELRRRLGIPEAARLALVGFGGIETPLAVDAWPARAGLYWIVPPGTRHRRADVREFPGPDFPFIDLLASADVVLTKPGYGTFAEAACHGVAVLYAERGDWPEEPYLAAWLHARVPARVLAREMLQSGDFGSALDAVLSAPRAARTRACGVAEAVAFIAAHLGL